MSNSTTTIVIPCFNEAVRLKPLAFLQFIRKSTDVHLLMVNDGSSDATITLLEDMASASNGRISVLDLPQNRGKAEAVRQGVLAACRTSVDFVGYWDADLATPLGAIPSFIDVLHRLPQIELVIGTRLKLQGRNIDRNRQRRVLGRLFSTVASQVLGVALRDTQCGAKLFRVTPEMQMAFSRPFLSRWIFDVEVISRLIDLKPQSQQGLYEFPLDSWQEVAGSKLKPSDFLKAIGELARIYLSRGSFTPAPEFVIEKESGTSPVTFELPPAAEVSANPERRAA
ncbi:glycosyl transferase family 2 [Planctopirus limnophila DSM 3776]|uniref:Glycosyl transferase family 2 n=1 Tax=Planctopirus limnophila (strain ATCC 43296 / DSM 3776 / IFAM 1008 / Mu 290) TaxID=521674 RepID=D5SV68_PLAL2|nr:glycosyltransferase [Planctopirus limnophila]ADG69354.1 glycosyl transferase family 2 [Planctopirus limnophila DSM 3776]